MQHVWTLVVTHTSSAPSHAFTCRQTPRRQACAHAPRSEPAGQTLLPTTPDAHAPVPLALCPTRACCALQRRRLSVGMQSAASSPLYYCCTVVLWYCCTVAPGTRETDIVRARADGAAVAWEHVDGHHVLRTGLLQIAAVCAHCIGLCACNSSRPSAARKPCGCCGS